MKKACLLMTIGCVLSLLAKTGDPRPLSDGYLFAQMVPENYGGLYYSVSRDGLHWELLNGGLPINPEYKGHPDIVRGGDGRWHAIGIPRDFKTFTKPKLLFAFTGADAEMAQIDTIFRKYKDVYYAVIKDERWEDECQTGKLIRIARSQGGSCVVCNPRRMAECPLTLNC